MAQDGSQVKKRLSKKKKGKEKEKKKKGTSPLRLYCSSSLSFLSIEA
jgi:hypothetical protein